MATFINEENKVDTEGLIDFGKKQLTEMKQQATYLLNQHASFWIEVHNKIIEREDREEKRVLLAVEQQMKHLPMFAKQWVETALDSKERFDFFVMTKAQEIGSGDNDKDYFWALTIRHDQIIALVRVLRLLIERLEALVKKSRKR